MTGDRFDLAAVIGPAALARLAELAGGLELYVPTRLPCRGALAALPSPAQEALVAAAGGSIVYVPRPRAAEREARDAAIRAAAAEGLSQRALARRFGLSQRHVRRIVGDAGAGAQRTRREG